MLSQSLVGRIASKAVAVLSALVLSTGAAYAVTPTTVIISQLYGAGGNSGATLNADYVELFNPTGSAISLAGYSVQYASATGTSISATIAITGSPTLQPGQYYLLSATPGGTGTAFTADQTSGSIAFGAAAGRVYLSSGTTAITSPGCAPFTNPAIVDSIPYGTTSCANSAPAPSTTKSDVRVNNCSITGNPATDYTANTVTASSPRNSQTPLAACASTGGSTTIGVSGLANPASINTGTATLLTATITPATNPASTGIKVSVNLNAIGGSTAQKLYDDGSNGDLLPNDNVFSYSTTVNTPGNFTFTVAATDDQLHTGNGSITLTAATPPQTLSIDQIQGNGITSPYAGTKVTTSGIVTAVTSSSFYIQTRDSQVDADPSTPEGILVYSGSTAKPAYIALGAEVQVSGTVASYPALTTTATPGTEIDSPTFSLLTTGNPLPAPVVISSSTDSPSGGIYQFHKYEGMRVAINSFTATEGTDANLTESTETNTSDGLFYGVVTGVPRPFREPGIAVNDVTYNLPIPSTVTRFDSNPELLEIDSLSTGGPAINLTATTVLSGISGVMDFSTGYPEIILDAANRPTITGGGLTVPTVPAQTANEFTVASFNMERFYTSDSTAAKNPGSSVVVVTPEAYQRRLKKASIAVRNVLNSPDILGAQEIQDLQVLTDLANQISADASAAGQTDPAYSPYLYLATDGTGINTGFLVKNTVTVQKVEQFGLTTTFTNATGAQATLNDRTPLVLHAGIKRAGAADFPVTVIDVHQRSLNGVDDPSSTGQTVRLKREAQAEFLANLIQGYQSTGEHVITVGDFNSFQFSDGFVDTIGVTTGNPVPANQVIIPPTANLVTPNLIDLITTLPAAQQQSYTFAGSAQVLDHVLITQDLLPYFDRIVPAHFDADFPLINLNDATSPSRVSDHDPEVAYFAVPAAVVPGTVQLLTKATLTKVSGGYQATITITNSGTGTAQNVQLTAATVGPTNGTPLPQTLGNIAPNGGTATTTVLYPASAGNSGTAVAEKYSGTYTSGTFSASIRAALP